MTPTVSGVNRRDRTPADHSPTTAVIEESTSLGYLVSGPTRQESYAGPLHHPGGWVEWGSITKTATAATLYWAQRHHGLDLLAPAARYLGATLDPRITITHLITHTSGLPRMPPGNWAGPDPYAGTGPGYLESLLPDLAALQVTPPGAVFVYSNLGYALLGEILRRATALSWWQCVRQGPLRQMALREQVNLDPPRHTRVLPVDDRGRSRAPWNLSTSAFAPAGGLWSTLPALLEYTSYAGQSSAAGAGWQRTEQMIWHNGATRDSQTFAAHTHEGVTLAAHALEAPWGAVDDLARELADRR